MDNFFDEKTPWEIREQILQYNATFSMSDVERAKFLGLPKGCRIRENAKIIAPQNLTMGENCWIGEGAILDASGGLTIGSNVSIGLNVMIWTHDSCRLNIRGHNTSKMRNKIIRKPTCIGDNCFISGPSVVMPGVKIGNRCVIGAMSVVYDDLPEKTVFQPYKAMCQLKVEIEQKNKVIEKIQQDLAAIKAKIGGGCKWSWVKYA